MPARRVSGWDTGEILARHRAGNAMALADPPDRLKVALLTQEYPPGTYGGAGVHVEYLARELHSLVELTVHCQGADRTDAVAHRPFPGLAGANPALQTISADLSMIAAVSGAQIVHSHTWFANLAGHIASLLYGVPHVMTVHSLEPLRPWRAEQLGGGYAVSSWCERVAIESAAAVIAVSGSMRADVLSCYPAVPPERVHLVRNGIDADHYRPDFRTGVLRRHGVDPTRPSVVFVGRIARQKGLPTLIQAAAQLDPAAQLVLCVGRAETPELAAEVMELVTRLRQGRSGVIWIDGMTAKDDIIQMLSHATVFVCPSTYEPLGIVNLEAMACGTPVVASRVGGIPEAVEDGQTGLLVPPCDPTALACAVNVLLRDPALAAAMGQRGRKRAAQFGWSAVAEKTARLYAGLFQPAMPSRPRDAAANGLLSTT
jgi:starch synthase